MSTDRECAAAVVAAITAYMHGDDDTATRVGVDITRTPADACSALGFACGIAAGLLAGLETYGLDPHVILADMGLRIAQGRTS